MLVDFFPTKIFYSTIFNFHFCENPHFRNEFQALPMDRFLMVDCGNHETAQALLLRGMTLMNDFKAMAPAYPMEGILVVTVEPMKQLRHYYTWE